MGYYGLPKAKLPDDFNALEKLLRTLSLVGAFEALDILETLTRNAIQNHPEEKYRRVRTTNPKLAALFGQPEALAIMHEMGWRAQEGEFLALPRGVELDFPTHVNKILEAKSHYAKLRESAKKTARLGEDPSKAKIMEQLELDRRERAASYPAKAALLAAAPPAVQPPVAPVPSSILAAQKEKICTATDENVSPAAKEVREDKTKPKSSFDFAPREKPHEEKRKEAEMSLQELRALQKEKFKDFQADPDAKNGEAYKRPPGVATQEPGWFDWMWGGGSSSSSGGGGGGGQPPQPSGPRMKTMRDLPKPVKRG